MKGPSQASHVLPTHDGLCGFTKIETGSGRRKVALRDVGRSYY